MRAEIRKNGKLNIKKRLHKPYLKNRITFTSELYPSDKSTKSIITAGASGSFSIRLLPLAAAIGFCATLIMIAAKFKSGRH